MRSRTTGVAVVLLLVSLGGFSGTLLAAEKPEPKTDVARWYAEDPSRLPKCQVAPEIEKVYPDIHATLAALKYALANEKGWQGVTWSRTDEKISEVRRGEIEALDDPSMTFGWKADQMPMNQIKKGKPFNDGVTKSGTLVEFHQHAFMYGNDQDPISPRPPAEVMRTLSHELAHVWDHRVHTITLHSVDLGGVGLPYDFQKLVPAGPFDPTAIREIRVILGTAEPEKEVAADDKDEDPKEEENPNKFYIYAIETSGPSLYIARPGEAAKLTRSRALKDSGLDGSKVEAKKLSTKGFLRKEDAVEYLKKKIKPGKANYWTGKWVKYKGVEYRTVHVPDVLN